MKQLSAHRNAVIFTGLFLLSGILLLSLGFWKTVLLLLFGLLGFTIGKMKDNDESFAELVSHVRTIVEK